MNNLIILEYKESIGQWHYNSVYNNEPKHELETDGWESIAYTEEKKARYFTYMIDCKNNRRKALNSPHIQQILLEKNGNISAMYIIV